MSINILLTNDDGIKSPGLWAAAEALSALGFVTVAAPREQSSGTGRSMPSSSDGVICEEAVRVGGKTWKVFAIGGTPAQAVQHGIFELMPNPPDLVVSGINYGENAGIGVTISGTVGAALEGGAQGIPALAVSLQADSDLHLSYSTEVDFSIAAHFTAQFARMLLGSNSLRDVDALKVEVPADATTETGWRITSLARVSGYRPIPPKRARLDQPGRIGYTANTNLEALLPGTDLHTLLVERMVAVTPLSLDLTSRISLKQVEDQLRR